MEVTKMINCTGMVKVFNIDMQDHYTKSSGVYGIPPLNDGDEWENDFINLIFVGGACDKMEDIEEKDQIYITSGILRNRDYENRDGEKRRWTEIKVFDFITRDQAEDEGLLKRGNGNGNGNRDNGSRSDRSSGSRSGGSRSSGRSSDRDRDQDRGSRHDDEPRDDDKGSRSSSSKSGKGSGSGSGTRGNGRSSGRRSNNNR
jgi:single-stranded DNA-binding protein